MSCHESHAFFPSWAVPACRVAIVIRSMASWHRFARPPHHSCLASLAGWPSDVAKSGMMACSGWPGWKWDPRATGPHSAGLGQKEENEVIRTESCRPVRRISPWGRVLWLSGLPPPPPAGHLPIAVPGLLGSIHPSMVLASLLDRSTSFFPTPWQWGCQRGRGQSGQVKQWQSAFVRWMRSRRGEYELFAVSRQTD